jgi:hypothetical protein
MRVRDRMRVRVRSRNRVIVNVRVKIREGLVKSLFRVRKCGSVVRVVRVVILPILSLNRSTNSTLHLTL